MTKKKTAKEKNSAKTAGTVTCLHCRYEYPASEKRCTLCGHPWPWVEAGKKKP